MRIYVGPEPSYRAFTSNKFHLKMKRKPFNLSGKVSGSDKVHLIKYARNFKFLLGSLSFRSGSWHLFCVWFISWFITIWGSAELISVNWELMSIIGRTLIFTLMSVPLRLWCYTSHYEWSPEGTPMRDPCLPTQ